MTKEKKHDNFVKIATKRTRAIVETMLLLENLTNKSFYDYTNDEMKKVVSFIDKQWNDTRNCLLANKGRKEKFKL